MQHTTSDGTYTYTFDDEGNRTARFIDNDQDGEPSPGDTNVTTYAWDVRNRLSTITTWDTSQQPWTIDKEVFYTYDAYGRRILKEVDEDGDSLIDWQEGYVYDGAGSPRPLP